MRKVTRCFVPVSLPLRSLGRDDESARCLLEEVLKAHVSGAGAPRAPVIEHPSYERMIPLHALRQVLLVLVRAGAGAGQTGGKEERELTDERASNIRRYLLDEAHLFSKKIRLKTLMVSLIRPYLV